MTEWPCGFLLFKSSLGSSEFETCCCLPLGQSGGARWPRPCMRAPQEHCTKTSVSKYCVTEVWLQMQEHPHSTHSSWGGCMTFTVLNYCFHARFWKGWGFWYPMVYRGFFWKLGWWLWHWYCRFCTKLDLILWTLQKTSFAKVILSKLDTFTGISSMCM